MIDVGKIREAIEVTPADADVPVSRAWLRQAIAEIEAGRAAQEQLGTMFGVQGKQL